MAKRYTRVELFYDGMWNDITAAGEVRASTPIAIKRGRGDSNAPPTASSARLVFDNRAGKYNPRDPSGSLYGKIGRNTPIRIWAGGNPSLTDMFNRSTTNQWTGTGALSWSLSGGTVPDDYDVNGTKGLHTHPTANVLHYSTVECGSAHQRVQTTFNLSTGTLTGANASVWLLGRLTDTSNYYAAIVTYTPSGDVSISLNKRVGGTLSTITSSVVTHSGYSGLFASVQFTTELYIEGDRLYAKMWDTTNFDEPSAWNVTGTDTSLTSGTKTGVASRRETGNTNANLAVAFDTFDVAPGPMRFCGEVASWKPRETKNFHVSGGLRGDAWTEVEAAGILRRIGRGIDPLKPALYRAVMASTTRPLAYWPMFDPEGSGEAASAVSAVLPLKPVTSVRYTLPGGQPVQPGGAPVFGRNEGPAGSGVGVDFTNGGTLRATVPQGTSQAFTVDFTIRFNNGAGADLAATVAGSTDILHVYSTGTYRHHAVNVTSTDITVFVAPSLGAGVVGNVSTTINLFDGAAHHIQFSAEQNGANVDYFLLIDGATVDSLTLAATVGGPLMVDLNPLEDRGPYMPTAFGNLVVWNQDGPGLPDYWAAHGYPGETAANRFVRLLAEEGITAEVIGDAADSQPMGAQATATLVDLLAEIEKTDDGVILESRHVRGLTYLTGRTRYAQTAALALDFTDGQISDPFEPAIDDTFTRNDVTVRGRTGALAQATRTTGPLNLNDPGDDPDGVGRTSTTVDANPESNATLTQLAGWYLAKGTVDEPRYQALTVDLDAAPNLEDDALLTDVADRITIDNLPGVPDTLGQNTPGYTEVIETHRHTIEFSLEPDTPYDDINTYNSSTARYDAVDSELNSGVNSTATSLSVKTTSGPLWTTRAGAFPFDINVAGERITVTNITGASSPQTFTVTRSVNGVSKAQAAAAKVSLFNPTRYAL